MKHTNTFKAALTEDLKSIVEELQTIAVHNPTTDDWTAIPASANTQNADVNVQADTVEEWEVRRALMPQLETRYKNITRALAKISNGTYGICEVCSKPIEPARLEAHPAARTDVGHSNEEAKLPY